MARSSLNETITKKRTKIHAGGRQSADRHVKDRQWFEELTSELKRIQEVAD